MRNAYQENRNLLLSKSAHADSIPGLEILANGVRCTHGATLGAALEARIPQAYLRPVWVSAATASAPR